MSYTVKYLPEAQNDLQDMDNAIKPQIVKGIRRVSENPCYPNGYGKPLGNYVGSNLAGLYKIKFKRCGIRVVYALARDANNMTIIIISARADELVYKEAEQRRKKYDL